jgi:beta-N-acetylhexosaminidase
MRTWAGSNRGAQYGLGVAAAAVAFVVSVACTAPVKAPAPELGRKLSNRQLAGQRVIYSYPGLTPPPELFDIIRRGEAGGVIFFGENIDRNNPDQIRGVVEQLQQANEASPVRAPLLMMTDQEGGLVRRLPGEPVLSAKQIGEFLPDPEEAARFAGGAAGENLKGAGMNVNLAPVLDVFREPDNFIDHFQRSFSDDPAVVARLGTAFVEEQQRTGVAATAKHFPGLGAAARAQDTDTVPVTLDVPLQDLRSVDELPYTHAIPAGVDLVMTSWAIYPAYDQLPAGLSRTIVQGELRRRLGFRGVTITDALEAGALNPITASIPERGVLAADAGMDLLLFSGRNVSQGTGGVDALVNALDSGRLNRGTFRAAVQRVIKLREKIGQQIP